MSQNLHSPKQILLSPARYPSHSMKRRAKFMKTIRKVSGSLAKRQWLHQMTEDIDSDTSVSTSKRKPSTTLDNSASMQSKRSKRATCSSPLVDQQLNIIDQILQNNCNLSTETMEVNPSRLPRLSGESMRSERRNESSIASTPSTASYCPSNNSVSNSTTYTSYMEATHLALPESDSESSESDNTLHISAATYDTLHINRLYSTLSTLTGTLSSSTHATAERLRMLSSQMDLRMQNLELRLENRLLEERAAIMGHMRTTMNAERAQWAPIAATANVGRQSLDSGSSFNSYYVGVPCIGSAIPRAAWPRVPWWAGMGSDVCIGNDAGCGIDASVGTGAKIQRGTALVLGCGRATAQIPGCNLDDYAYIPQSPTFTPRSPNAGDAMAGQSAMDVMAGQSGQNDSTGSGEDFPWLFEGGGMDSWAGDTS